MTRQEFRQEFEAKQDKIIAAYRNHPNAISAFQGDRAVCRDFDDAIVAAIENAAQDFNEETHPAEFLEMFESSLEGILTA